MYANAGIVHVNLSLSPVRVSFPLLDPTDIRLRIQKHDLSLAGKEKKANAQNKTKNQKGSVAGVVLGGGRRVAEEDVAHERADGNGDHDPAVVRHEDEPGRLVSIPSSAVSETKGTHMIMKA